MLIALLSDLHWARGPHWAEIERVHAWIADDLEARVASGDPPALIVLAGDIFDAGSWPAERNAAAAWVQRLATLAPVLILRGNHDRVGDLDLFAKLRARCAITVYDKPAIHRFQGGAVAVLPWLDRVAPGRAPGAYSAADEARAEVDALLSLLDRLGRDLAATPPGARLFAGHLMVHGAKTSHGQPRKQSREFEIGLQDLARVRADAYLLGHVHLGQTFFLGRAPVIYNGSITRTAFGELEQKRYTLVRLGPKGAQVGHVVTPTTPMLLVEGRWEHGKFSIDTDKLLAEAKGAQVRLTYEVEAEDQAEARRGAEALRTALGEIGATLKPVPCVIAPVRPRATEIVLAKTLAEKFDVWCTKNSKAGAHVDMARRLLVDLEQSSGAMVVGCRGGGARLHRVRVEQMAGYRDPVELDVDALPGRMVAVFGPNGVGKSLLLGCWPGAMYGKIPADTRPDDAPLDDYAMGPNAHVEAVVDIGGSAWTLERKIGRGKAFATGPDGKGPTGRDQDGKITEFDRWARGHLLPKAVFLNSIFAPQGSEGLIKLRPGTRREVLLEALGLEGLKVLAEQARHKAAALETRIEQVRGSIAADLEELRRSAAPEKIETARQAHRDAEEACAQRRGALGTARSADAVNEAARAHRRTLEASTTEARALCDQLAQDALSPLLTQATAIRRAHEAVVVHRTSTAEAKETRVRLAAEAALLDARATAALAMAAEAAARREAIAVDRATAAEVLHDGPAILAAVGELPELEDAAARAAETLEQLVSNRHSREAIQTRAQAQRLEALRAALAEIAAATDIATAKACAAAALLADVPGDGEELERLDRSITDQRQRTGEAVERLASCRLRAARAPELARATARAAALDEAAQHEHAVELDQRARAQEARQEAIRAREAMPPLPDIPPDAVLAERLGELVEIERRAPRAAVALVAAQARVQELERALVELPVVVEADHTHLEQAVADAEHAEAAAFRQLVILEEAHGRAAETKARADRAAGELADVRMQHRAWGVLAEALGPKGIPLCEIDALGPELTAIANDLLHSCYGPRFTLVVDTRRPDASGEGFVNEVILWVHDAEANDRRDARAFNAGARFFSGLALSLALAVVVCARAGATNPTIVRDEHAAGLSVDNRAPAMQMMRRACDMIGAQTMLIVTHDREFAELADCAVMLDQGRLEVRHPVVF